MIQFTIDFLIQNTIWSILTCGLVAGLALILRRRPAVVHLVGVLALIAMLTPPLFSVVLPGSGWFRHANRTMEHGLLVNHEANEFGSSRRDAQLDLSGNADESLPQKNSLDTNPESTEANSESSPIQNLSSQDESSSMSGAESVLAALFTNLLAAWPIVVFSVWIIGGLAYLTFIARQAVRFKRLINRAKPACPRLSAIVENESERIRLRHAPVVKKLNARISPFVFLSAQGPQLVMPTALVESTTDSELGSLILHELAHVKRRDPAVRFLELFVTAVFWFNPAMWGIRHLLRRSEELACDAVVARSLKATPEIYARAFLKTIDFLSVGSTECPSQLVCTVGGYRFYRRRLAAMVTASNHAGISLIQRVSTAVIAVPLLMAGFQIAPYAGTSSDSPEVAVAVLSSPISKPSNLNEKGGVLTEQEEAQLTTLDLAVMQELSGVMKTPNIIFHYRPDDLDDDALEKVVEINLEQYRQCEEQLDMKYDGVVHIFLYRDVADLQKTTGTGAVAFSTGTVSVHQAMDFESVHELTHIFALQFPKDEDEVTDMFAVEGLATILAETDENIPIHSWAAVYQSKNRIPNLVEFRRSWPGGVQSGVHPYHVAGSFVGYLIGEFGIEKVKRWYVHSTEAHMEFGKTFRRLERDWLRWLERQTVRPEHQDHILAKLGLVPAEFATAREVELFDGKSLSGLQTEDKASWKTQDGRLVGHDNNTWTYINTKRVFPANVGVRVKFRLVKGKAITVRLNCTEESNNHVNLATWATYVSAKDGGYVGLPNLKIKTGEWNEVVVVNENGTSKLYLNGIVIGEYNDILHTTKGSLSVGVEGGTIEVEDFVAFEVAR